MIWSEVPQSLVDVPDRLLLIPVHWRRQLWGTGARAPPLDFQLVKF